MKNKTLTPILIFLFCFIIGGLKAQVPVPNFSPSKLIVIEKFDQVTFHDSSTNNPIQWEWDVIDSISGTFASLSNGSVISDPFNSGADEFSKNPLFQFTETGLYTVKMRSRNASGWSNWLVRRFLVKVVPSTQYFLGYGMYGPYYDNIVDSDSGNIYDDGGINLNYGNAQGIGTRSYLHIKPCRAKEIHLKMKMLRFKDTNDYLMAFDGDKEDPNKLLAKWTFNQTGNRNVVAYSGSMYVIFRSNSTGIDSGYFGRYEIVKDTSAYSINTDFSMDSLFYKAVPTKFINTSTGYSGVPQTSWFVNGTISSTTPKIFRNTFTGTGQVSVCLQMMSCDDKDSICKNFFVDTPNSKTKINFTYKSNARYAYDSVSLIPLTDKANRFQWYITPKSYTVINPPANPSYIKPGFIFYQATPGDSLPRPVISFLDTVCYTIKLIAYNSTDSVNSIDSFQKTNYICAGDFRNVYGVFGKVYHDQNNNCQLGSTEEGLSNMKVKLYDGSNNLIGTTYTYNNGLYRFDKTTGTYKIVLDVDTGRVKTFCPIGYDSTVSISTSSKSNGVNFGVNCSRIQKPDIGTRSVVTSGLVFPGRIHYTKIKAGLLNKYGNMDCSDSVKSGSIKVTVAGKVTYQGVPNHTLTPSSVSGKVITWNISDFSTIDMDNDLEIILKVDTNATFRDSVRISVEVTPKSGDPDTTNNLFEYQYRIVTSHDPNMKEVYPEKLDVGYDGWLTYTIHFQNTGTAPAFNIRLEDTLDQKLDLETFEVLDASHASRVALKGRVLNVYFDDIMLPDSSADKRGSNGYFQYRIKALPGQTKGTQIKNTAYIYFDYNAAVVTNTTVNEYVEENNSLQGIKQMGVRVYPNPGTGLFQIQVDNNQLYSIKVMDIMGHTWMEKENTDSKTLDLRSLDAGIYFVSIYVGDSVVTIKLIKAE